MLHPAHPRQQPRPARRAAANVDGTFHIVHRRACYVVGGRCRRQSSRVLAMQQGPGGPADAIPAGVIPRPGMPYQQPQQYVQQPQTAMQPQLQPQQVPYTGGAQLARRPQTSLQRVQPQALQQQPQAVYLEMSQVVGKQVVTSVTARSLGVISTMWIDPVGKMVVSLDLDDKKGVGSQRICNFPLSRLTQIGDVVLVHDESVLYDQPLDGRYGYYILNGMQVRTVSGEFLGKVRDYTFSPDTGEIERVIYDDFGLSFLPVAFFDTYSLPMADVISLGVGGLIVNEEARYRERRESPGLFAAIPSLLRSLNSGGNRVAGVLTDGSYRQDDVAGYLPQGYTMAQWQNDVRRWEQETGLSYEQYTRRQGGPQQRPQLGTSAPRAPRALPAPASQQPQQQQQPPYRMQPPPQQQQQQQQPGYGGYSTYQGQPQQTAYGAAANPYQQQAQAPQPQAQQRGYGYDPRARPPGQQMQRPPQQAGGAQAPLQPQPMRGPGPQQSQQPSWPTQQQQQGGPQPSQYAGPNQGQAGGYQPAATAPGPAAPAAQRTKPAQNGAPVPAVGPAASRPVDGDSQAATDSSRAPLNGNHNGA